MHTSTTLSAHETMHRNRHSPVEKCGMRWHKSFLRTFASGIYIPASEYLRAALAFLAPTIATLSSLWRVFNARYRLDNINPQKDCRELCVYVNQENTLLLSLSGKVPGEEISYSNYYFKVIGYNTNFKRYVPRTGSCNANSTAHCPVASVRRLRVWRFFVILIVARKFHIKPPLKGC